VSQQGKKVLHFIESGGLYGAESVLLNLSGLMARGGGFEPLIGCIVAHADEQSDLYDKALELGLTAHKIVIRNTLLPIDLPRTARLFRQLGVDLIHSHGYKPSVFGHAIKRMSGIEVLATCHLWYTGGKGPLKMRVMVALELQLYKSSRVVVGVSDPIKKVLIDAGVPAGKIKVIKNGVAVGSSLQADPQVVARLRRDLNLGEDDFCVLNAGRLTKQKAQWDIITAAGLLRDRGVAARFLIVGAGEMMDELKTQIAAADLADSVQLLGFRDDMSEMIQVADLFVLPSLDEGMPMGLLEASAAGLPAVVTPVGDIPKLIEDQVSGWVVPMENPKALAEAIADHVANPDKGRRLAHAARERVKEHYSTESMFAQYCQVYSELLD
jgi:glycosyltransferase involved in cell wall biosynthesis